MAIGPPRVAPGAGVAPGAPGAAASDPTDGPGFDPPGGAGSALAPGRAEAREALLRRSGWEDALPLALSGDASFRRYERLTRADGHTAILMDAPPGPEDVRPFITLARHLVSRHFSAPLVLAADPQTGFLLLEDLGDDTFSSLLSQAPADQARGLEDALYSLAVDTLIALHRLPLAHALPPGLASYTTDVLLAEAGLFADWYLPAVGLGLEAADRQGFDRVMEDVAALALGVPETLVLRDFHVDNLMRLSGRPGIAACGLLDFQDALRGPRSYDLMSLLEDARRDLPADLVAAMKARYLAAFPDIDPTAWEASWAALAAQRHLKVIGIFTRLDLRDGKPAYLAHIPRLWRLVEQAVAHPGLEPLRAWLDRHAPPRHRKPPPRTLTGEDPPPSGPETSARVPSSLDSDRC